MGRKRYTVEQIIRMLREAEVDAYSADCDRLVRPIVITDSEHCDHSSERSDG